MPITRLSNLRPCLTLLALAIPVFAQTPNSPTLPWRRAEMSRQANRWVTRIPPTSSQQAPSGWKLLIAPERGTATWLRCTRSIPTRLEFAIPPRANPDKPPRNAWLVRAVPNRDELLAWPVDAPCHVPLGALGPGNTTAWISAGENLGIQLDDAWLVYVHGQPVARLDTRFIAPRCSACSLVPLVQNAPLRPGMYASLWPTPAQRNAQCAVARVVHVEARPDVQTAWIPAPWTTQVIVASVITFERSGRYLGHGHVEKSGPRLWRVRFVSVATQPTPLTHATRPATLALRVGDVARWRTRQEIDTRTFQTHIFEQHPEGWLIDAGEPERIAVGDTAFVLRGDTEIGRIRIQRVQAGYSIAAPHDDSSEAGFQPGDRVCWQRDTDRRNTLGRIESVHGDSIFQASLRAGYKIPAVPIRIEHDGQFIAVAWIVGHRDNAAIGFARAASLTRPIPVGAALIATSPRE